VVVEGSYSKELSAGIGVEVDVGAGVASINLYSHGLDVSAPPTGTPKGIAADTPRGKRSGRVGAGSSRSSRSGSVGVSVYSQYSEVTVSEQKDDSLLYSQMGGVEEVGSGSGSGGGGGGGGRSRSSSGSVGRRRGNRSSWLSGEGEKYRKSFDMMRELAASSYDSEKKSSKEVSVSGGGGGGGGVDVDVGAGAGVGVEMRGISTCMKKDAGVGVEEEKVKEVREDSTYSWNEVLCHFL